MAAGSGVVTAEELIRLPSDTWRYELVRGELRRMTPAGHVHGRIAAEVLARLALFVREHQLGVTYAAETGFILERSPDTVRAPDASFVSASRLAAMALEPDGYFPGPPDFAVEVMSPSDRRSKVEEKVAAWLDAGCHAVLVLDPSRKTASLHRPSAPALSLSATDQVTVPDLLPGWSLSLDDLFR